MSLFSNKEMMNKVDPKVAIATTVVVGAVGVATYKYFYGDQFSFGKEKSRFNYNKEKNHGGNLFAMTFANHGVKFVFTLIGGHVSPILAGCEEAGLRVIDMRHEVNTVFAADAVSRLSGVPGVAVVTAGPGLTNTVTAVKNAQMAQSPVILIGGATSDLLKGMGSLQDIDQISLLKPHVKWYKHVATVSDIVPSVEEAFYRAQEGTPGPVFLEVAIDVLYKEGDIRKQFAQTAPKGTDLGSKIQNWYINRHLNNVFSNLKEITFHEPSKVYIPKHSAKQVQKIAQLIRTAKRPFIMVGSQAMLQAQLVHNGKLSQALDSMSIPTGLSGMARGLLGRNNKIQVRQKETRRKALRETDLIILAGLPCDFRLEYGFKINRKATYVAVNRDPVDLYKNKKPHYPIQTDACLFLLDLAKVLKNVSSGWSDWSQDLQKLEKEGEDKISSTANQEKSDKVNPLVACKAIEEIADPNNAIFIADGGDFVGSASYIVQPRGPLSWLDPGAFGTLGCGMGFAIGAKLVRPESEVWVIFGDGALGFSMMEYDTCVRHNIPIISVVGNDASWSQILRDQVRFLNTPVACLLSYTNYHESVKGLGAEGLVVSNEDELNPALNKCKEIAQTQKKPVLLNILIGKSTFREGSISV